MPSFHYSVELGESQLILTHTRSWKILEALSMQRDLHSQVVGWGMLLWPDILGQK